MRPLFLIFSVAFLFSCTGDDTATAPDPFQDSTTGAHAGATDTIARSSVALQEGCFEMTMKKDTAMLQIRIRDPVVSGRLDYRWHEKDHNTGTLQGVLRDSMIIAEYRFESEGITSVREVVFKIRDDTLLQGYGELQDQQGKIVFTNRSTLQYPAAHPFIRVACAGSTR